MSASFYKAQLGDDYFDPYKDTYRKPTKIHLINDRALPLCNTKHVTQATTDPLVVSCRNCLKRIRAQKWQKLNTTPQTSPAL